MSRYRQQRIERWAICGALAVAAALAMGGDAKAIHRARRAAAFVPAAGEPAVDPGGTTATYVGAGYGANPVGHGFGGYNLGGYPLYGYAAYLPAVYAGFNDYAYGPVGFALPGGYGCFACPADPGFCGACCLGPRLCGWRLRARWACEVGCAPACMPSCAPSCEPLCVVPCAPAVCDGSCAPCVRPCAYRRYMRRLCRAIVCCAWTCVPAPLPCCFGLADGSWDGEGTVEEEYVTGVTDEPAADTFEQFPEPVAPANEEPPSPRRERAF